MVALTFPDGARREYPPGTTGLDVAKGISPSLAKRTAAMVLDDALADLGDPIDRDARIELISREDPRALELIRHDAAHVLAEAVQTLWPGTQVTIFSGSVSAFQTSSIGCCTVKFLLTDVVIFCFCY